MSPGSWQEREARTVGSFDVSLAEGLFAQVLIDARKSRGSNDQLLETDREGQRARAATSWPCVLGQPLRMEVALTPFPPSSTLLRGLPDVRNTAEARQGSLPGPRAEWRRAGWLWGHREEVHKEE